MLPNVLLLAESRYLQKHHGTWVLQVKVPVSVQAQEGRKVIRKSLQTGDLRKARAARDIELGRLQQRWERLRELSDQHPSSLEWVQAQSSELQADLRDGKLTKEEAQDFMMEAVDRHLFHYKNPMGSDEEHDLTPEHEQGIQDAVSAASNRDDLSLDFAVNQYLSEIKDRIRLKSWNQKKRYLEMLKSHHGALRPINSLNRTAARSFMQQVIHKLDVSVSTRKTAFAVLRAFGQWCEDSGVAINPFVGMGKTIKSSQRGVKDQAARRPWTNEELESLFAFKDVPERYWKVWYGCALLLLTGARRGEILNARLEHLTENGKGLEVVEAKNQESLRTIPLHPLAQPLVETLRKRSDDGYLLPGYPSGGQNGDDRGNAFLKQFNPVRHTTVGIGANQGLDLHSLRHTFETLASNQGMDQRIINQITGHANDQGTGQRVYLHGIEFDVAYQALTKLKLSKRLQQLLKAAKP